MSQAIENVRPAPDRLLAEIADYVCAGPERTALAWRRRAIVCWTLWAAEFWRSTFPPARNFSVRSCPEPLCPTARAFREPVTNWTRDAAAFNIGCAIRWLDFNDTWLAAEWGHPSDNLGAILAVGDYLGRARREIGLTMRDVLTAMIQAHEIQGVLALGNSFNRAGLDHVLLVRVASTAVATRLLGGDARADHQRRLQRLGGRRRIARLSSRAQYRSAQIVGRRRRHGARCVARVAGVKGEMGYPSAAHGQRLGISATRCFAPNRLNWRVHWVVT